MPLLLLLRQQLRSRFLQFWYQFNEHKNARCGDKKTRVYKARRRRSLGNKRTCEIQWICVVNEAIREWDEWSATKAIKKASLSRGWCWDTQWSFDLSLFCESSIWSKARSWRTLDGFFFHPGRSLNEPLIDCAKCIARRSLKCLITLRHANLYTLESLQVLAARHRLTKGPPKEKIILMKKLSLMQ